MSYDLNTSLGHWTAQVFHLLRATLNQRFQAAGHDVTREQWKVLVYIQREPGIAQRDLETRVHKNQPALTKILNRLETKGLISRSADATDRRIRYIALTPRGEAMTNSLSELAKLNLKQALRGISSSELEQCLNVLKRVYANLAHDRSS